MFFLILGLLIFLGLHSIRIYGEDWRGRQLAQRGEAAYKGIYSALSGVSFVLIIWGYGLSRAAPIELYSPPGFTRHLASLLMLVSLILLVCAYLPGTRIKGRLHHPMVISVKVWAFAHLIANGRLGDVLLFGSFLVWAIFDLRAAKARDRREGISYAPGSWNRDGIAVVIGIVVWWLFARYAHVWLIGVAPM
jgi:uncharacterized membrane protein